MLENQNSKPPKILFAEDCPDTQMMISYMLEQEGYDVTVVNNGQECVDKICSDTKDKDKFDIVVLDVKMPVLDGHQTAKILRGSGFTQPIVALTACCGLKDAEKSINSGCDDHVSKLVGKDNILNAISRNLEKNSTEEHAEGELEEDVLLPIYSSVLKTDLSYAPLVNAFLNRLPQIIKELEVEFESENWEIFIEKLKFLNNAQLFGYNLMAKLIENIVEDLSKNQFDKLSQTFSELKDVSKRMVLAKPKVTEIASRVNGDLI